jgi:hypothetical protein
MYLALAVAAVVVLFSNSFRRVAYIDIINGKRMVVLECFGCDLRKNVIDTAYSREIKKLGMLERPVWRIEAISEIGMRRLYLPQETSFRAGRAVGAMTQLSTLISSGRVQEPEVVVESGRKLLLAGRYSDFSKMVMKYKLK